MTEPTAAQERGSNKELWAGLDHIANFINSLDSSEMTGKQVRSAIYSECLQPTIIHSGDHNGESK